MVVNEPTANVGAGAVFSPSANSATYVDWGAVFAGAVLAAAVSLLFTSFGSAIGLTMSSTDVREDVPAHWYLVATGLWFIWVSVSSVMAGGYLAGRMRRRIEDASEHEVEVRDGAHGLLVWAFAVLIGGTLAAIGVAGVAQSAASTANTVVKSVSTAASQADGNHLTTSYLVDTLFRGEAQRPRPTTNEQARQEVVRILAASAAEGEVSKPDQEYMGQLLAAETDLELDEANARVATMLTELEEAAVAAKEAAEKARVAGILVGFLVAATLLISAAGAYIAAGIGGRHRDEEIIFPGWGYRR